MSTMIDVKRVVNRLLGRDKVVAKTTDLMVGYAS